MKGPVASRGGGGGGVGVEVRGVGVMLAVNRRKRVFGFLVNLLCTCSPEVFSHSDFSFHEDDKGYVVGGDLIFLQQYGSLSGKVHDLLLEKEPLLYWMSQYPMEVPAVVLAPFPLFATMVLLHPMHAHADGRGLRQLVLTFEAEAPPPVDVVSNRFFLALLGTG
ncbi:hypothetical protein LIER_18677 [Lithospermum erythrorhizon]|uniref:Uncharacterized protein n=1 Tax=Lithospermum erythrorhizon TaxID=34254 RepID=A0AAV3QJB3_LITER